MSNEIEIQYNPSLMLYAIIRNSALQVWTGSAFETFNSSHWSTYAAAVPLEGDASGFYAANFPTAITTADIYGVEVFWGSGSISDPNVGGGSINWNGTTAITTSFAQLTSLATAKSILNITTSAYDSVLNTFITIATQTIQNYCHQQFVQTDYNENYDGNGSTLLLLRQKPILSVDQVTLFQYNTSPLVIPGDAIVFNPTVGTISVSPSSGYISYFPYDGWEQQQSINVQYTAGWTNIPSDLQYAASMVVGKMYNKMKGAVGQGSDTTMDEERLGQYIYRHSADWKTLITPDIEQLLFNYTSFGV